MNKICFGEIKCFLAMKKIRLQFCIYNANLYLKNQRERLVSLSELLHQDRWRLRLRQKYAKIPSRKRRRKERWRLALWRYKRLRLPKVAWWTSRRYKKRRQSSQRRNTQGMVCVFSRPANRPVPRLLREEQARFEWSSGRRRFRMRGLSCWRAWQITRRLRTGYRKLW